MVCTFFDRKGSPFAYSEDGEHLFLFSGQPVGYFHGENVYAFSGKHLGTFEDGWLRDHAGGAVLFSDAAIGGPIKPIKMIVPIKSVRQIKPIKGIKAIPPIKAIKSLGWSSVSCVRFFDA